MNTSSVQQRGKVPFAAFTGENVYMREFTKANGLPADLRRWQDTVDAMLDGINTTGPIYLMVNQGLVRKATTMRRPGVHVDGFWNPGIQAHGSPSRSGHTEYGPPPVHVPSHGGGTAPSHSSRIVEPEIKRTPVKRVPRAPKTQPDADRPHGTSIEQVWSGVGTEGLLLATDELGCVGYLGDYIAPDFFNGGDCHDVDVSLLDAVEFEPGLVWAGNTRTMLHESVPARRDFLRTVVRLNVPGWAH